MGREDYEVVISAGMESDSNPNEPYRYVRSRVPSGIKTLNEEPYKIINQKALLLAREIILADKGKRNLILKLEVNWE